ncbi:MAG: MFS transporter, partial [Pseudomonadota bacterium]
LLDAAVADHEKAVVQGANDTLIALVSTLCAFAAGFVVSSLGWTVLALVSIGILVLALTAWAADRNKEVVL